MLVSAQALDPDLRKAFERLATAYPFIRPISVPILYDLSEVDENLAEPAGPTRNQS